MFTSVRPRLFSTNARGSSIVGVLVGIGIVGIIVAVLMQTFKNNSDILKKVQVAGEVEDLRRLVRLTVNCTTTFAEATCPGTSIELLTSGGSTVVASEGEGSAFGDYRLKASCSLDSKNAVRKIDVQYFYRKESQGKALFKSVPFVCPL